MKEIIVISVMLMIILSGCENNIDNPTKPEDHNNSIIAKSDRLLGTNDKAVNVSETYPDNTQIDGGKSFSKTWTIKNTGTTTWNSSYKLKYVGNSSGRLSSITQVPVANTVKPGSTYTFSVPMTAPAAQSSSLTYKEDWKFTDPSGNTINIGSSSTIWAKIIVPAKILLIPTVDSFTGGTKWGNYSPFKFSAYYKVAYEGYSNSAFRITLSGKNLDKVTRIEIVETNYRKSVTINSRSSTSMVIEIFALTNGYSDKSPCAIAKAGLKFFYNDGSNEKYIQNNSISGILPTYNNAGQSWGQCTWYAGYIKMLQISKTPCIGYSDGFKNLSGDPNNSGFPKAKSILNCSGKHMAYVEKVDSQIKNNSDGSVTYNYLLHISDYNSDNQAGFRPDFQATWVVKKSKSGTYSFTSPPKDCFDITGVRQ